MFKRKTIANVFDGGIGFIHCSLELESYRCTGIIMNINIIMILYGKLKRKIIKPLII
jgi:hypothetical protein